MVIDEETVGRLRMLGGDDFVVEAMQTFVATAERLMNDAESGVADGNLEGTRRACHTIRGSSGNVGAKQVFDLSAKAESAAKEGDSSATASLVGELRTAFDTFVVELKRRSLV